MSENIVHVTDSTFEDEVLKSERPIMVDYWAEWCGPCKAIAPVLEEIADEYNGKITIAKMDVDQNQETPQKYAVRGIPTLMIFKNGEIAGIKVGQVSKSQLEAFIDSTI
jgi:thioredoxin 1